MWRCGPAWGSGRRRPIADGLSGRLVAMATVGQVAELVAEAYRMVAAPHLIARLDTQAGEGKRGWRADWIGRDAPDA